MPDPRQRAECIVQAVLRWAIGRNDIRGVAFVGSHARGTARPESDIDLVILAEMPEAFRTDPSWLKSIDWRAVPTGVSRWEDEDYGAVWSRRIWLVPHFELEISLAPLAWASVSPLDPGTRQVVADGCHILHDPDGVLDRLLRAIRRT
jgi:uncharacterized protein